MPRAMWSGAISFGLINVPVKLYSATSRKTIRFRELRASDHSRIRHKRVAETDGEEVEYDDIVKGYEISPDQYVVLTREELAEVDPEKSRAIEIEEFVDLEQIDPIYFDNAYYLAPDTGAQKAYRLLVDAMAAAGKVAIARFVLRGRENLAALRAVDGAIAVATMRFADEVVPPSDLGELLPSEDVETSEKEVEMARQLIEQLSAPFAPERYEDTYRQRLLELIEAKAEGQTVVSEAPAASEPTAAPDLMKALEESLQAVRSHQGNGGTKASGKGGSKAKKKAGSGTSGRKASGGKSGGKSGGRSRAKA